MASVPCSTLTHEEELYWLALHLAPGLGVRKAHRLIEEFGGPPSVFRASRSELEAIGLATSTAQSIASGCIFEDATTQHQKMLAAGVQLITFTHDKYPALLREIYDPPLVLFARGNPELLNDVNVAIVGTRRPSAYGMVATERLATDLAAAGVTVVSGMARGIDTKAHTAVLDNQGNTVAVFGCGVDVIYPAENRKLADRIAEKGLLLSEFPMGAPGLPQNFPVRNRIVSGISAGVIVVEGAQYSGSTITAKLAVDQNREVFAVPGNITSKLSWAPNLLIKQGAKLVQDANDVLTELPEQDRARLAQRHRQRLLELERIDNPQQEKENKGVFSTDDPMAPAKSGLLRTLTFDKPANLDHLMEVLEGNSASELIAALFELELLGLVRQLPGKNFIKVWTD
jgi:DNA processing protein